MEPRREHHRTRYIIVIHTYVVDTPRRRERHLRIAKQRRLPAAMSLLKRSVLRVWRCNELPRIAAWSSVAAMAISVIALLSQCGSP